MMDSSNAQFVSNEQPKKSNMGLIIGIVIAVVLCCCCLMVVGGLAILGPAVNSVFSSVNQGLEPGQPIPDFPEMPGLESTEEPSDSTSPSEYPTIEIPAIIDDVIPQGGLGDDLLRAQTWTYAILSVSMSGCATPVAKDTTIEVTQEQDSSGVWKERWNVACEGSQSVPVDVTFTPAAGGGTDISVTLAE